MEERGLIVDDSGMDEEDRYGAVVRDVNPNKYTPPALRKQLRTESSSKKEAAATEGGKTEKAADATTALHHLKISNLPKGGTATRSPVANLPTSRQHATDKVRGKNMCDIHDGCLIVPSLIEVCRWTIETY